MDISAGGYSDYAAQIQAQAREQRGEDSRLRGEAARIQTQAQANGEAATTQVTYSRAADGSSYVSAVTITRMVESGAPSGSTPTESNAITPMPDASVAQMQRLAFEVYMQEKQVQNELQMADASVRTHEGLHFRTAGGIAVGTAEFDTMQGPDGRQYAVAGAVEVRTTTTSDPEQAASEAQDFAAAATAPGDASAQDMSAARMAHGMASEHYGNNTSSNRRSPTGEYNVIA